MNNLTGHSIEGVCLIILQDILLTAMDLTFPIKFKFETVIYACCIFVKDNLVLEILRLSLFPLGHCEQLFRFLFKLFDSTSRDSLDCITFVLSAK